MSLSVIDELNSLEDQVLNTFRKTLGAPLPLGTDLQLNVTVSTLITTDYC